tara:strand:+ start:3034 stop:3243 length:210 start_codon:yes stop_codon:yes gene_type:complete
MEDFKRGDIVWLRDYPFGSQTSIYGRIVGVLERDYYNILLQNGLNEGTIRRYKWYKLLIKERTQPYEDS